MSESFSNLGAARTRASSAALLDTAVETITEAGQALLNTRTHLDMPEAEFQAQRTAYKLTIANALAEPLGRFLSRECGLALHWYDLYHVPPEALEDSPREEDNLHRRLPRSGETEELNRAWNWYSNSQFRLLMTRPVFENLKSAAVITNDSRHRSFGAGAIQAVLVEHALAAALAWAHKYDNADPLRFEEACSHFHRLWRRVDQPADESERSALGGLLSSLEALSEALRSPAHTNASGPDDRHPRAAPSHDDRLTPDTLLAYLLLTSRYEASTPPGQRFYYYYLPYLTSNTVVSGTALGIHGAKPLDRRAHLEILRIADTWVQYLVQAENRRATYRERRRSALAAIVARNFSHNIGSHVLAADDLLPTGKELTKTLLDGEGSLHKIVMDLATLHQYIQRRFDFIARLLSQSVIERMPTFFVAEIVAPFRRQTLLLTHLLRDSGYPIEHLEIPDVRVDAAGARDVLVALRGGAAGAHAFYSLLENILRNATKYGLKSRGRVQSDVDSELTLRLDIRIKADESADGDYWCWISENLSDPARASELAARADEPMVDDFGPTHRSQGIHDMVECARQLSGNWINPLTFAQVDGRLAYGFRLPGARRGLLLDWSGAASELPELLDRGCHTAVLHLSEEAADRILRGITAHEIDPTRAEERWRLPPRLVIHPTKRRRSAFAASLLAHATRRAVTAPAVPNWSKLGWSEQFIRAYATWIRSKLPQRQGDGPDCVLITYLEQTGAADAWRIPLGRVGAILDRTDLRVDFYFVSQHHRIPVDVATNRPPHERHARRFISEHLVNRPERCVVLDRHRGVSGALGIAPEVFDRIACHHPFSATAGLFALLQTPPAEDVSIAYLLLTVLEGALARVAILDERVAESLLTTVGDSDQLEREELLQLTRAGIYPVVALCVDGQSPVFVSKRIEAALRRDPGLEADVIAVRLTRAAGAAALTRGLHADAPRIEPDFFVHHDSLIKAWYQSNNWFASDLGSLARSVPFLVKTSGSGSAKRSDLRGPTRMPFVEFSIIADNTYRTLDKPSLVRSLMAAVGASSGD